MAVEMQIKIKLLLMVAEMQIKIKLLLIDDQAAEM